MKRLNLSLWEKVKTVCWSSDHAFNPPLFSLLIFLFPTQFGRHFWFPFSYVHGLRLDYLSLTLYTTDILIVLLFLHLLYHKRFSVLLASKQFLSSSLLVGPFRVAYSLLLLAGVLFAGVNVHFSQSPFLSLYGWIKLSEVGFFSWYVYQFCKDEKRKRLCLSVFLAGVSLQAALSLLQFYHGGSLGGFWYFLGERMFTGATPGIANASVFGQLILRPYGTLPHPNVLAAYLVIGIYFLLFTRDLFPKTASRMYVIAATVLFVSALVITLSRIALSLTLPLLIVFSLLFLSIRKVLSALIVSVISIFLFFPTLLGRFAAISLTEESVIAREVLLQASLKIIQEYPLWGVGLFAFLPTLGKTSLVISFALLQPVHSVPVLIVAELGIPAALILLLVGIVFVKQLVTKKAFFSIGLISLLLFLSVFDHYFWTLQQGQLLAGFCLAISFLLSTKTREKIAKTTISKAKKRKI